MADPFILAQGSILSTRNRMRRGCISKNNLVPNLKSHARLKVCDSEIPSNSTKDQMALQVAESNYKKEWALEVNYLFTQATDVIKSI